MGFGRAKTPISFGYAREARYDVRWLTSFKFGHKGRVLALSADPLDLRPRQKPHIGRRPRDWEKRRSDKDGGPARFHATSRPEALCEVRRNLGTYSCMYRVMHRPNRITGWNKTVARREAATAATTVARRAAAAWQPRAAAARRGRRGRRGRGGGFAAPQEDAGGQEAVQNGHRAVTPPRQTDACEPRRAYAEPGTREHRSFGAWREYRLG